MLRLRRGWVAGAFVLATGAALLADADSPPANYYASVTPGLTGTALEAVLNDIIDGHTVFSYDSLGSGGNLGILDRDPANSNNVLLIYSFGHANYSRSKTWDPNNQWNREHTWPDSRGILGSGPDYSDIHHLRASDTNVNSSRGNKPFDNVGGTTAAHVEAPDARANSNYWEPPDVDKGWIARAMFYMATRYDGVDNSTTDLRLVETPVDGSQGGSPTIYLMGRLSALLEWNRRFPPSDWERRRNHEIYTTYQRNRNPFIDFPELADAIYAPTATTRYTWRSTHFTLAELADALVSGDLADPDNDGLANLLEMAFQLDPRRGSRTLPLSVDTAGLSPGRARVVTARRTNAATEAQVSYALEVAPSLGGPWAAPAAATETLGSVSNGLQTVTVEFNLPVGAPPVFVRVVVTRL